MHSTDPQPIAAAIGDFQLPTGEHIDLEQRARDYHRAALMKDRRTYWQSRTPPEYRAPESTAENPRHNFNLEHPAIQANRAQLERILSWQPGKVGLLASGRTDRGKTRAMFALCHRLLCEQGIDVGIWHAQEFFSALQAEVRYGTDDAGHFIHRQASRPVLFIDDYGQEALLQSRAEWSQGWFLKLVDHRVGHGLPLLLTTNLSAKDIAGNQTDHAANALLRRLINVAEPLKFT
jgi:DNA replication protein DnaC